MPKENFELLQFEVFMIEFYFPIVSLGILK